MDSHGQNNGRARYWQNMNPPHMQQPPGMYLAMMPSFAPVPPFNNMYPPHVPMNMMGASGCYPGPGVHGHHRHHGAGQGDGGSMNANREKTTMTVWIGKIGAGVTDKSMRMLLEVVGGLVSWRRTTDKMGQIRAFGFADFLNAKYVLRAKAILMDLQVGDSRLSLKMDEKTQTQLEEYAKQEHAKEVPEELDAISQQIKKLAKDLNAELGVPLFVDSVDRAASGLVGDEGDVDGHHRGEDQSDQGGVLSSSKGGGVVGKREEFQSSRDKERKRDQERKRDRIEADREREARRLEQMKKDIRKLERKLELEQRDRIHGMERRREAEEERRVTRLEDIKLENEDMEEWRARICSSEYRRARKRERELEDLDREDEEDEIREERRLRAEEVRRREQHHQRLKREEEEKLRIKEEKSSVLENKSESSSPLDHHPVEFSSPDHVEPPPAIEPVRIQLNPRFKLGSGRLFEKNASPDSDYLKKDNLKDDVAAAPAKKSEDTQSILDLVPTETTPLFAMQVSWELIEEHNMLENKIRSWITKKVVEYLDVEETELIDFICHLISERTPPQEIISQLQPVLEDEADVFVLKLWRMLVYEMLRLTATTTL